jgi:anhydro-N-acetylmuramic acid kinase
LSRLSTANLIVEASQADLHRRAAPGLYIGLMSGTSLDGIDAVLVDTAHAPAPRLLAHSHHAFADDFRQQLAALCASGPDEIDRAGRAQQQLARDYARAVNQVLQLAGVENHRIRAIGAHGQTIRHRPEHGYTVQLNPAALLAELCEIDVIADFRSRDMAAGGQGAPLVAAFHAAVFATAKPRVVVNIGGIANVTALPGTAGAAAGAVIGFDCGPGNLLLDAWTQRHFAAPFDRDGALAAGARADESLLVAWLNDPYFTAAPPKSTGREHFTLDWVQRSIGPDIDPRVVLASLTRLTARAIGQSIAAWASTAHDVVICGGGARNRTLMQALAEECGGRPVMNSEALGVAPEQVEAMAFAWLAQSHLERRAGNVPSVTGARGGRVLGALYPGR